jgi:DNA polymerase-1
MTAGEVRQYLSGTREAAFDFETAPKEEYRGEEKAALDAHKDR